VAPSTHPEPNPPRTPERPYSQGVERPLDSTALKRRFRRFNGGPLPTCVSRLLASFALVLFIPLGASAEVILPPLPSVISLETDGSTALHSTRLPLGLPFGVGLIRVEFSFAVGTRELPSPGSFLDSFSLSFEPPETDASAFVFNHDARGETWFPNDPDGIGLSANFLQRTAIPFPVDDPEPWPVHASYAVTLTLPLEWQNCEAGLWLDLFDNRTGPGSFALLQNLRLVAREPFFLLESSATPVGPFSAEMGVVHTTTEQRFELMRGGVARFFRLRADSAVRLRVLERHPYLWRFAYDFPEPDPKLESATQPQGPYTLETHASLDSGQRRFQLKSSTGTARFFRIRASVRTAVTRLETTNGTNSVTFEYRPRIFSLQSSAQPCGPFADDPSATFDTANQVISLPRHRFTRVFRVAHSNPGDTVRLRTIGGDDARWLLPYDLQPTSIPQSPQGNPTPPRDGQP